ncbi:MAG: ribosome silencing factor [Alphaproteobacteria bacterium]|jgi:ribosome-associated protein|nr:MAG: ribosome silencing factor [Alphaproteobacteria bacterium]
MIVDNIRSIIITISSLISDVSAVERIILTSLDNDKAEHISLINLQGKTDFADAMIIADGRSSRHVASMADKIADQLKQEGIPILGVEGTETCDWVLIDVGDIVVHLFKPGIRDIYQLDKMWSRMVPDVEIMHV